MWDIQQFCTCYIFSPRMFSSFVKTYSKQTFWGKDFIPAAMDISSKAVTLLARFLTKNVCFIKKILQFHIKMSETQQPTRVLAHSYTYYPSYREARTVGWIHWIERCRGLYSSMTKDFYICTRTFQLWKVKQGGQCSPMKFNEFETRPSSQYCS